MARSSSLGAAFNILCTVVGTGLLQREQLPPFDLHRCSPTCDYLTSPCRLLLSVPHGVKQIGWIGIFLLSLLSAMACYTAIIIVKCFHLMRRNLIDTSLMDPVADPQHDENDSHTHKFFYSDIGQAAYGKFGAWFVTVQMHLTLTLVGTIYHLLAASNLSTLISLDGTVNEATPPTVCVLLVAAIVWFHVFLKTLSEVAVVSYFNIGVNATLLVIVVVQSLNHPPINPPSHQWLVTDNVLSLGEAFASFGAWQQPSKMHARRSFWLAVAECLRVSMGGRAHHFDRIRLNLAIHCNPFAVF